MGKIEGGLKDNREQSVFDVEDILFEEKSHSVACWNR